MAFTGEAVRQGDSNRFGVPSVGSIPRAFVSFGGEPYVITRNGLIHITDLENGSGVLIQNNSNYDLSSPDPTCGFAYNSRLYFLDRGGSALQIFNDPLTGDVSLIDFYTGITTPAGAATDDTTVWVYDSTFDALHTINPDTAATTLLGTVGFDVTTPANNIGGMFYHGGSLYLLDNGTELMFVIEDPSAATLEATAVDVNVVEFGASQRGVNGGSVHDGEAYMAGGNPDALYRFYNVRWNETIAAIEVDSGGDGSLDLSTVSSDATSFEFLSSYTAPSWLTISGNDLVITGATDVTSDTDYSPEVRAIRGSFHEDETLTVRVAAVGSMIVTPSEPRSLLFSTFENSIVVSWDEASDNGGESPTRFDVRIDGGSWISTGLDTFYAFGSLSPATEYTIEVAQVNSAGRGAIASGTATTNSVPIVVPGAPTSLSLSETHNSIVATWAAANDNGGEAPIRFDIRIDGGTWIDTGLDLTHTFSNLSPETEYTVEVAQVNSAGRGASVSRSITTDAAPNTAPSFSQSFYAFTDVAIAMNTVVGTVAATDADNDTLSYSLTGSDASDFAIDADGEITVASTELTHSDTYTFNVVADDATDTTSVAVTVTAAAAAVSNLPVWQTGSALESSVDALASASIDITGKVSGETEVTALRGVLDWMEWDGSTLDITEAPIYRKETVFKIRFRAKSADGSTDATYLLTVNGSRLIWMHSTLLCKPPINYEAGRVEIRGTSTVVSEMTDNRYETFSDEDDVDIDVSDADSNATKIEAVAFVSKNVDAYSLTPTGGTGSGFSDRDVPSSFDTRDGRSQSRVLGGFQWEFYPLPAQITATSVRLQFSGTDVEMYAVMLLELLTEIRDGEFVDVIAEKVDRAGNVSESDTGRVDRASRLGAERWKWETQYLLNVGEKLTFGSEAEVLRFLRDTPDVFCVQEAARYPARMHLAVVSDLELTPEQKGVYKGAGSLVPFSVAEQ